MTITLAPAFYCYLLHGAVFNKGDRRVSADIRRYGIGSIDSNLKDPNFAVSRLKTFFRTAQIFFHSFSDLQINLPKGHPQRLDSINSLQLKK